MRTDEFKLCGVCYRDDDHGPICWLDANGENLIVGGANLENIVYSGLETTRAVKIESLDAGIQILDSIRTTNDAIEGFILREDGIVAILSNGSYTLINGETGEPVENGYWDEYSYDDDFPTAAEIESQEG